MRKARKCKAEKTRAKVEKLLVHVGKLVTVCNHVIVDRLVERKTWRDIADEHGLTLGEAKRKFRDGVFAIEQVLEMRGEFKSRRRRKARVLKLRRQRA